LIVLDASAALELLLGRSLATAIEGRVFASGESLHAPALLSVEVMQVLRRYWLNGELTASRGREALQDLADLPIATHSHEPLLDRVWELRHNATAYDAVYLALAEALPGVLLTCDRRLASTPGHHAVVELARA
jgi:predicted nucleic acid-binding protein